MITEQDKMFEEYWFWETRQYGDKPEGSVEIEDMSIAKRAFLAGFHYGTSETSRMYEGLIESGALKKAKNATHKE